MHYHAEVLIPEHTTDVEAAVTALMAPFNEELDSAKGWWDWWQIGGRWKGSHVEGYDANEDSSHKETCDLCQGTGKRPDMEVENGCNKCQGTGVATQWPTQWAAHEGDVMPVQ